LTRPRRLGVVTTNGVFGNRHHPANFSTAEAQGANGFFQVRGRDDAMTEMARRLSWRALSFCQLRIAENRRTRFLLAEIAGTVHSIDQQKPFAQGKARTIAELNRLSALDCNSKSN
jgi:hypothetical protein